MTKSAPAAEFESLDDDDLLDAVVEEFTAICRTGARGPSGTSRTA